MRRRVVILGSTGSIGTQAIDVITAHEDEFELLALSCHSSVELISRQAHKLRPRYVGITGDARDVSLPVGTRLIEGDSANDELASLPDADVVLIGISGIAGLPPLLKALGAGKTVALANKESIVCGSALIKKLNHSGAIIPVDSEHSALFQCMMNGRREEIVNLCLTASGGPFWQCSEQELENVTLEQALKHPVWSMGQKVTIDSATLFNKGLELIEAAYLFDMPEEKISVLIHPQTIVHSMVEYQDGTLMAHMSKPDMRLSIQYALGYPKRMARTIERLSLPKVGGLAFYEADDYPAIQLARTALRGGEHLPIVYNAANEAAVSLFVERKISFVEIRRVVEYCMERAECAKIDSLEDVMRADMAAREIAYREDKSWR